MLSGYFSFLYIEGVDVLFSNQFHFLEVLKSFAFPFQVGRLFVLKSFNYQSDKSSLYIYEFPPIFPQCWWFVFLFVTL